MKWFLLLFLTFNDQALSCELNGNIDTNFIASSAIPFPKLMKQSMDIMHSEMDQVDLKKNNDRIFLEMMIAHHEGALKMANAVLVHSQNEQLKNYAISIITTQRNEIDYMKALLKKQK